MTRFIVRLTIIRTFLVLLENWIPLLLAFVALALAGVAWWRGGLKLVVPLLAGGTTQLIFGG